MAIAHKGPLMAGTRLFLKIVLGTFYFVIAIFVMAAVAAPFLARSTPAADQLSLNDAAIIYALLAFMIGLTVFFRQLQAIVKSVADGDPFHGANARRIEVMGWMALAIWMIDLAFIAYDLSVSASMGAAELVPEYAGDLIGQGLGLAIPLTMFILARVFRHGAAMREDLEGTV